MNAVDTLTVLFKKYKPDMVINSILDLGTYYVVNLTKPNLKNGDFVLDNLYSVNKQNNKIKSFIVGDDPKRYNDAMKRPVYIKRR